MKLEIRTIDNGWLLYTEGKVTAHALSIDAQESENHREYECEALQEMLYEIIEELLPHNKHEKYNLVVEVEEREDE